MLDKLIEKYEYDKKIIERELDEDIKTMEDCRRSFLRGALNTSKKILQDLKELKEEYIKVLNDMGDSALNSFLGNDK